MSVGGSTIQCEECGVSVKLSVKTTRGRWCARCANMMENRDQNQLRESERLRRVPKRCVGCGDFVEIDRNDQATTCFRCQAVSVAISNLKEFREPGVWRIGPVVFDWSGAVSAARCEACSRLAEWRWNERIHRTAINHAKYWHGVTAKPERIS